MSSITKVRRVYWNVPQLARTMHASASAITLIFSGAVAVEIPDLVGDMLRRWKHNPTFVYFFDDERADDMLQSS